jgi:hypothetical protein
VEEAFGSFLITISLFSFDVIVAGVETDLLN